MQKLEIDRHFEDVFDIAAANLDPKPLPQVYQRFLRGTASIRQKPQCSRIWRATLKHRTPWE